MPAAGATTAGPQAQPFPDEVARALADEASLARLAGPMTPATSGLRDIWETIVVTGRRVSEVIKVRLDCIGRYGGLAMLWHDQTKVGRYDPAIRIPERLSMFSPDAAQDPVPVHRPARPRRPAQRAAMALFPGDYRNPDGTGVAHLPVVLHPVPALGRRARPRPLRRPPGQAHAGHEPAAPWRDPDPHPPLPRATSPTGWPNTTSSCPTPTWRTSCSTSGSPGPAPPAPARCCPGPRPRSPASQAQALAIDLSRRSTPADGGFCTFQPVVDGGACPWNLDCHNCAKFVLSGADLLYWRRKREQWLLHRRTRPRRRHRHLAARRLRADRPRHRRAGSRPGRARPARRRARPGPAPPPGLLPAGLEHRVPRHRPRQRRQQPRR